MIRKIFLTTTLLLITGLFLWLAMPVDASPLSQAYYQTPTPGLDGRIIYIVQPGDSCLSISLLTGLDVNELRLLNNLDDECLLAEGQQLLLGVVEEEQPTPGPSPTPTQIQPTPTPFNGNGEICVFLFEDINGNAMAEETELPIVGGAISITDRKGEVSLTADTTDEGSICFEDLPEGDYNISVAPPEGYNPTTTMNYPLVLSAGDLSILDFGAQVSSQIEPSTEPDQQRSPILGILGGVLVLAGIGLGIYFQRMKQ